MSASPQGSQQSHATQVLDHHLNQDWKSWSSSRWEWSDWCSNWNWDSRGSWSAPDAEDQDHGHNVEESSPNTGWPVNTRIDLPTTQRLVFVLGMPKTGTSSLHEAFKLAGLRSVHWALDAGVDLRKDTQLRLWGKDSERRLVGRLIQQAISEGKEPLAHLPQVDALAEMNGMFWKDQHKTAVQAYFPQMSFLDHLVTAYPHAHFILNVRDMGDWLRSVDQHNDLRQRFVQADLPGLPVNAGARNEELISWVAAHHARVLASLPPRGAKLLHFNIDIHGSQELSAFLQCSIKWPHCNKTKMRS